MNTKQKPFIKFQSIGSFKDVQKKVYKFFGGAYSPNLPTVELTGRVKGHGTNGGVVVWKDGEVVVQSRSRKVSLQSDNAGFCDFIICKIGEDYWRSKTHDLITDCDAVAVYGEWIGGNIQANVGVSGMDKHFIVFSVQKLREDPDNLGEYLIEHVKFSELFIEHSQKIYEIGYFGQYSLTVDFKDLTKAVETLNELTLSVEANCPIASVLNKESENTIGEGIVWTGEINGYPYILKHKGEKHARGGGSKKVTVEEVSPEKLKAIEDFCKEALTVDRLLQGIESLGEMQIEIEKRNTGKYLQWVMGDIHKECQDAIIQISKDHDVTWKKLSGVLNQAIKDFYFQEVDKV